MIINRLEFNNLTSFRGYHEIDFDKITQCAHIFAVTGVTGAGKSSILTAITLALYGKNYKSNLNQVDFVTMGANSSNVNLYFSVGPKKYRAVWSCRVKNEKGVFLKSSVIKRALFLITYDSNYEAVDDSIEAVIGLDFKQFCRTVVLNQGEFASFLTSSFSNRKNILERLYLGEDLSLFSKKLKELIGSILGEVNVLTSYMEAAMPFSFEEVERYRSIYLEKKLLLKTLQVITSQITRAKVIFSELTLLEERIVDLTQSLENVDTNLLEFRLREQDTHKKLAINSKTFDQAKSYVEKILPDLYRMREALSNIRIFKKNIENSRKQISFLENEITEIRMKCVDYNRKLEEISKRQLDEDLLEGLNKKHIDLKVIISKLEALNRIIDDEEVCLKREKCQIVDSHDYYNRLNQKYIQLEYEFNQNEIDSAISVCILESLNRDTCIVCNSNIKDSTVLPEKLKTVTNGHVGISLEEKEKMQQMVLDAERTLFLEREKMKIITARIHDFKGERDIVLSKSGFENSVEFIERECEIISNRLILQKNDREKKSELVKQKSVLIGLNEAKEKNLINIKKSVEENLEQEDKINQILKEITPQINHSLNVEGLCCVSDEDRCTEIIDYLKENLESSQCSYELVRTAYDEIKIEITGLSSKNKLYQEQIKKLVRRRDEIKEDYLLAQLEISTIITKSNSCLVSLEKEYLEQLSIVRDELASIKSKIDLYDLKFKKREDMVKKLDIINIDLKSKQKLEAVIGKDEFRNFVLGIVELKLIKYANLELVNLCGGRYRLKLIDNSFHVVDFWNDGIGRKVSTLSGGETFLVSLALALSLSEMSRGSTVIDSFFIDEGFGNLDDSSIEESLSVLYDLANRGKYIGLITHIQQVQDQIPITIGVAKSKTGDSSIFYSI